ncbi:pyridine nucleotide-disulfide oxidoreductase-domain-containing protein [Dipodascopsis uninucleata]
MLLSVKFRLYQTAQRGHKVLNRLKSSLVSTGIFKSHIAKTTPSEPLDKRTTVVVLGSGWAGFNTIRHLDPSLYRCIVISPRSYFVFTPLLASISVGTLEPRCIVESIRGRGQLWNKLCSALWKTSGMSYQSSLEVAEAVATEVDLQKKWVMIKPKINGVKSDTILRIEYDKLVIAVGCYSQTFNIKGVKENVFFLKDVDNARKIRNRILERFEAASFFTVSEEHKRRLLHFCIVGGGPTGVEFAAELTDLLNDDLKLIYPSLMPYTKVTLFDVAKNILSAFDKSLSAYAESQFRGKGINIRTGVKVLEVTPSEIKIINSSGEPENIPHGLIVWSTGLAPNPFTSYCTDIVKDEKQNLLTDANLNIYCRVKDTESMSEVRVVDKDVYAIGDCAQIEKYLLPATAQVANQKAIYLSKKLNSEARGNIKKSKLPFTFENHGIMAYIGGWEAVVDTGSASKIKGRTAWLLWRAAYLSMSVSIKNKILIMIYWIVSFLFGRDISRF